MELEMKKIVWQAGKYKYRDAIFAYINQIRVAVVTPMHDGSKVDGKMLLPGLPKGTNSFHNVDSAKGYMEKRVEEWFKLVAQ